MSNVPSKTTALRWGGLASSGSNNEEDLLQIQSPQKVIQGWIDSSGTPWGNLATPGPAGPAGAPGSSNVPWVDIQTYGAIPKPESLISAQTSFQSTATSPDITVGSALTYFVNGAGICLWKAGAATSQSTPNAPTITAPPVTGAQTISYKLVGVDASGGLTAASSAGVTTAAPAVFGSKVQAIASATATGGVVTLNFSSPLNTTVTAGMTIHVVGITGAGATWCGIWSLASAPSTSQVTYNVAGASGTGTITGATARLSNTALIYSVSRSAAGVITVTTTQPHHFQVGTTAQPTIVILEGILTYDLNGHFVIASVPTATTFTCNTGNLIPVVSANLNNNGGTYLDFGGSLSAASATVWEYVQVACPALNGTTTQYYIYSDSPNPGGSFVLIGKTLYGESHFIDYGSNYSGGFLAPGYVPTAPPASAQNQLFSTTILSGGGTTSLVLADAVPSSVSVGGICVYDDGPALTAACAALGTLGGQVLLSPPTTPNSVSVPVYFINSPVTVPQFKELVFASSMWVNETIYLSQYDSLVGSRAASWTVENSFDTTAKPFIFGGANPLIQVGTQSTNGVNGFNCEGVDISCTANGGSGRYGLSLYNVSYIRIKNCTFISQSGTSGGTNVALVFNGNCVSINIDSINYTGYGAYGSGQAVGQSSWGPCIGNVVFRASDNPALDNFPPARVSMTGVNTSAGRGILIDGQYGFESASNDWEFSQIWDQAPVTPCIMFSGLPNYLGNITIDGINNDSESTAVLANWCGTMTGVRLGNSITTNEVTPLVTGNIITGLTVYGIPYAIGQSLTPSAAIPASFTTGSSTTDSVTIPGLTTSSHVSFSPTNAAAATMMLTAPGIYISSQSANTVVFTHGSSLSGATFDIICTLN